MSCSISELPNVLNAEQSSSENAIGRMVKKNKRDGTIDFRCVKEIIEKELDSRLPDKEEVEELTARQRSAPNHQ